MNMPTVLRRPRHDTTPIILAISIVTLIVGALLVWQNTASQSRYTTLREGQTTGQTQRTDQQQLTCALWAMLREDPNRTVEASVQKAADNICSTIPTPTPTSSTASR
jgi:hypothetical protein